jgi:hypothetical protein
MPLFPLHPHRTSSPPFLLLVTLGALLGAVASCATSTSVGGAKRSNDIADLRPVAVEHQPCDLNSDSADKIDLNGDGKPDRITVMKGGQPVCTAIDLNFDGRVDRYVYFDASGQMSRQESDYDRDGRIDEVNTYVNGVIVRKDREMNLDGKFDTWVVYKDGVAVKQDRDADGDGKVDEWWTFPDPTHPECGVVSKDVNGDGLPDVGEDAQFDLCKSAEEEAQAAAAAAGILLAPPAPSDSAAPSGPPPAPGGSGQAPPPPPPPAASGAPPP